MDERKLSYRLKSSPEELLAIARSRIEEHPSAEITGDPGAGTFQARGIHIDYTMEPGNGGTLLSITVTRKPPVPWKLIKAYLDREAEKW